MIRREVKTIRLRSRGNTARVDRDINRAIQREAKRGYEFVDLRFHRGFVHLVFAVPSRATRRLLMR